MLPTIFVSANSRPEHIVDGFAAGAQDYMTKPINKPELLARVSAQLENKRKVHPCPACCRVVLRTPRCHACVRVYMHSQGPALDAVPSVILRGRAYHHVGPVQIERAAVGLAQQLLEQQFGIVAEEDACEGSPPSPMHK